MSLDEREAALKRKLAEIEKAEALDDLEATIKKKEFERTKLGKLSKRLQRISDNLLG